MFSIIYHCSNERYNKSKNNLLEDSSEDSSERNLNLLKPLEKFFQKNSEHIMIILSIILLFSFTILKILFSFSISLLLGIILGSIIFLFSFYANKEESLNSIYNNRKILFIALLVLNLLRIISSLIFIIGLVLSIIFYLFFSSNEKIVIENSDNIQMYS